MPHRNIPLREERRILAEASLAFLRVALDWRPGEEDRFAAHIDELPVMWAVILGTTEGKPLSVSKIADMIGLPRNTCARRLEELSQVGYVKRTDRGFVATEAVLSSEKHLETARRCVEIVKDTAARLSKMDSQIVVKLRADS